MKACILTLFYAFLLTGIPVQSSTIVPKDHAFASHPDRTFSLEVRHKKFLVTIENKGTRRTPREEFSAWIQSGNAYHLLTTISAGIGGSFDEPHAFVSKGLAFIYVPTQPAGSGGFVQQYIFWIAPDNSLQRVEFEPASEKFENQSGEDEIVLTGGNKDFFVENNQLKFEFWVGRKGDPHCCPSLGTVTGTYKVVQNYSDDIRIVVDTIQQDRGEEKPAR